MKVANYRRELKQIERKTIINKYKELRDSQGGLFTSLMRRRLLAIKPDKKRNYRDDDSDMWYDIRTSVKNGIKDLELFCETASPDQIKQVFEIKYEGKQEDIDRNPSIEKALRMLLQDFKIYKKVKNVDNEFFHSEPESIEKDRTWKAELAYKMVKIGLDYFDGQNLITSKAHRRVVEEVLDMLQSEINHARFGSEVKF